MTLSIWLPGSLPGLNEIIAAAKGCRGTGRLYSQMKHRETQRIVSLIRSQTVKSVPIKRFSIGWAWVFPTKDRHDADNLLAGAKFVLDGLKEAGVIENDGRANVASYDYVTWSYGERPGVTVTITEV